jgi:hypothetical protein
LQKDIVDPLALHVLNGEFVPGDTVIADAKSGEIVFSKKGGDGKATRNGEKAQRGARARA